MKEKQQAVVRNCLAGQQDGIHARERVRQQMMMGIIDALLKQGYLHAAILADFACALHGC